jgi:predicted acyltransferase
MRDRARLASVDALRGLAVAAMLLVNDPGDWGHVFAPLEHAAWHGLTPADLIFPFFLFVVGVSLALALEPRVEAGVTEGLARGVIWRGARIVALGLALHAVAWLLLDARAFRPFGVLQRIGLCFAAVGLLAVYTRARMQWLVCVAILFGYWALLSWGGPLTTEGNLASRIDAALLGRFAYEFDAATGLGNEPEGLLSTLPAIATTILGLRAGAWLRAGSIDRLVLAGLVALGLGAAWTTVFPLNKQLWTSSYVLCTGGAAMLALALAHQLIDRRGWPALGRSLGVNAIAAYAAAWLAVCMLDGLHWAGPLYVIAFGWMTPWAGPFVPSLAWALAFVALFWTAARGLERRGIRIVI